MEAISVLVAAVVIAVSIQAALVFAALASIALAAIPSALGWLAMQMVTKMQAVQLAVR